MIPNKIRKIYQASCSLTNSLTKWLAKQLVEFHVSPFQVTLLALSLGVIGPILWLLNRSFAVLAGILLWASLLLDNLNGDVARICGKESLKGKFLDRVSDRLVDGISIVIIMLSDIKNLALIGIITLFIVFLVTYIREIGENIGVICKVGIGRRNIRLFLFGLMLLFSTHVPYIIEYSLYLLTALSILTFIQRLSYILNRI